MFDLAPFNNYKDQTLIKNKHLTLTYADVFSAFKSWSYYLKQIAPTGNIALAMPNCVESHIIMLAALQCHNVVLLNIALLSVSPGLLDRLNINHLVTFDDTANVKTNTILLDKNQVLNYRVSPNLYPLPTSNSLVFISSGTTGNANPTEFTSAETRLFSQSLLSKINFQDSDCLYNVAPYYHAIGFINIFTAINTGGSYYIPGNTDYKNIINDINQFGCTWICAVPNLAKIMIKSPGEIHSNFRLAMVGGDICNAALCKDFRERFRLDLLANYGFTEGGGCISITTPDAHKDGSVGKINPKLVKLIDNEVYARRLCSKSNSWVSTGDIGTIDEDGYLWIKSRKKDTIKRQGKTIFPAELEEHLEKVEGVVEVVVYKDTQNNRGDRIGVVYTGTITEDELKAYCVDKLHSDYYPHKILKLQSIPKFNNKISRIQIKNYVDQL